jgi:CBS domain-containing membrane protein
MDARAVELVPLMATGLHQAPIVDRERRPAGMVAQPDLAAALHGGRLAEAEAPPAVVPAARPGLALRRAG